jgi:glycosyltransferase involved in cell wall biosynthesis
MSGAGEPGGPPPTFSILMAAYGTEPEIGDAIRSVLAQTRSDWELIVVDDGSPDDLVDVVTTFLSDPRVRLIRQPNAGAGAARNTAAGAARGSRYCIFDSDDQMAPEYLAQMGRFLDEHPDVDVVACDARLLRGDTVLPTTYYQGGAPRPPADRQLERLFAGNFVCPGAMVRRSAFDAVGGFDPERGVLEDFDLWVRIANAGGRFALLDRPLLVYRVRPGGVSRDQDGRLRLDPLREHTIRKHLERLDLAPAARRAARRRLAQVRQRIRLGEARAALRRGDLAGARRGARAAVRCRPTPRAALIAVAVHVAPGRLRGAQGARADGTASERR